MELGRRESLRLGLIQNEEGAVLVAAIILLFLVSTFLFSIVLWHDSIYRNYDSLEVYYEKETINIMKQRK
jgi:hypothetical protein